MVNKRFDWIIAWMIVLIAIIGVIDALIIEEVDLVAIFVILLVLMCVLLVRAVRARRAVKIRPDLASWLQAQADLTGEPVERIADRAVATYRLRQEGAVREDHKTAGA